MTIQEDRAKYTVDSDISQRRLMTSQQISRVKRSLTRSAPLFKDQAIREILRDRHSIADIIPRTKRRAYKPVKVIGRGEFGIVFEADSAALKKPVAIKRYLEDSKMKNREIAILKSLKSENCAQLIDHFYSSTNDPETRFAFIVTDLFPSSLHRYLSSCVYPSMPMHKILRKLFAFRLFHGLNYLHTKGIIHRDINTKNLLVDPETGSLVISDFGSAKLDEPGKDSTTYIGDKCNRAPELIFGNKQYTNKVDIWAAGCVFAEMLRGKPLFAEMSQNSVLYSALETLGADSSVLGSLMHDSTMNVPRRRTRTLAEELPLATADELDLLEHVLVIDPKKRFTARQCVEHRCFDVLFNGTSNLPNNCPIPVLDRCGYNHLTLWNKK